MKIKGSLLMSVLIISGFGRKICPGHVTYKLRVANDPYLESRTRFAYSLYNFHGSTVKTKGSLLMGVPIISGFGGKIWLGHVTCKLGITDGTTPYLESRKPICLFTIQLSCGYDED